MSPNAQLSGTSALPRRVPALLAVWPSRLPCRPCLHQPDHRLARFRRRVASELHGHGLGQMLEGFGGYRVRMCCHDRAARVTTLANTRVDGNFAEEGHAVLLRRAPPTPFPEDRGDRATAGADETTHV